MTKRVRTSPKEDAKNHALKNENPLSQAVVETSVETAEAPAVDPEKEKQIEAANATLVAAEKVYAEAKANYTEAKQAVRKLTGKSKEPKGPGVIATIFTLVEKAPKKNGISRQAILDQLIALFPDRASEGMSKTIAVQLPGRMSKEKKVKIVKLENGNFMME